MRIDDPLAGSGTDARPRQSADIAHQTGVGRPTPPRPSASSRRAGRRRGAVERAARPHTPAERTSPGGSAHISGRERQLDDILTSLEDADGPHVITVLGERGAGRSAVLRAAADELLAAGVGVLALDCLQGDRERPFLFVLRLVKALERYRLGVAGHRSYGNPAAMVLAAIEQRDQQGVRDALRAALAQPTRIVIVADDVQHADSESLQVLNALDLARTASHVHMVASLAEPLGTGSRGPFDRGAVEYQARLKRAYRVVLPPLDRKGIATFLAHRLKAIPDDRLVQAAHSLSRGVPAALDVLVAAWTRADAIKVIAGHALLVTATEVPVLPENDRFLVALHELGEPAVSVASALSVLWPLGRAAEPLVARTAELSDGAVRQGLRVLLEAAVLEELPGLAEGVPRGWRFRVPLTEHSVRERMGPLKRGRLSAAAVHAVWSVRGDHRDETDRDAPPLPAGGVLEEADSDAYLPDRITEAGRLLDSERAVAELSSTAERLRPDPGRRGALRWLKAALRLTEEPVARDLMKLRYAQLAYAAGDYHAARVVVSGLLNDPTANGAFAAPELQEVAGLLVGATAAGGHGLELSQMATGDWWNRPSLPPAARLSGQALALCALSRWHDATALLERTERKWSTSGPTRVLPRLYHGAAAMALGSTERFRRSLDMPEIHSLPPGTRYTVTVLQTDQLLGATDLRGAADLLGERGLAPEQLPPYSLFLWRYLEGRWDEALELSRQLTADGQAGAPALRHRQLHSAAALVHIARGGIRSALRLVETARAGTVPAAEHILCRAEAEALGSLGDRAGAEQALRRGLTAAEANVEVHATDELWAALADLYTDADDPRRAADCLEQLRRIATRTRSERTRLLHLLGSARLAQEDDAHTAHKHVLEALALARGRGQPFETATTLLAAAQYEKDPAPLLYEAYELLGTSGSHLWRFRTRTAMRDAGLAVPARSRATAENDHLLATLTAEGLTNRQIAAVLRISEDAVANRLTRLFARTGARSRTEIISAVLSGGPLASDR